MDIGTHPTRGPDTDGRQPTIVVGYDGSTESLEALTAAATRVPRTGRIIAVFPAEPASAWLDTPYYASAVRRRHERATSLFEQVADLDLGGVTVEAQLVDGPAPEALAEVASHHDAEEIIVGSRGRGGLRGALTSVSQRLLRIADRPVVVVPKMLVRATAGARRA